MFVLGYALRCILFAQEVGGIIGRVETEQGDPLQQITVRISDEKQNFRRETTADVQGNYRFLQLPIGLYQLETNALNYTSQRSDGIQVSPGVTVEVNLRLSPVQQVQSIGEVEAPGEEERNPNIFIAKIDLNALRDPLRRQGIDPVFIEFSAVKNFYGVDLGAPLRQILIVQPGEPRQEFHGSLYEAHQNSAANARPFFNVGPLRPSRRNPSRCCSGIRFRERQHSGSASGRARSIC